MYLANDRDGCNKARLVSWVEVHTDSCRVEPRWAWTDPNLEHLGRQVRPLAVDGHHRWCRRHAHQLWPRRLPRAHLVCSDYCFRYINIRRLCVWYGCKSLILHWIYRLACIQKNGRHDRVMLQCFTSGQIVCSQNNEADYSRHESLNYSGGPYAKK